MIVDQQNLQGPRLSDDPERDFLGRRRAFGGARQPELDPRALADLAVDPHGAARLAGEAIDHGQAKAGALADFLGGEEGLGDLLERSGAMPLPLSATASTT